MDDNKRKKEKEDFEKMLESFISLSSTEKAFVSGFIQARTFDVKKTA